MILLVSTCKDKLSDDEFVRPIADIVGKDHVVVHYKDVTGKILDRADKVILCGTALHDNAFLDDISEFEWLKDVKRSVLGICSGMEIIALVQGMTLHKSKQIGMKPVVTKIDNPLFSGNFDGFMMHGNSVSEGQGCEIIARSESLVACIRKGEQYGVQFHPEVRHEDIINRFLGL